MGHQTRHYCPAAAPAQENLIMDSPGPHREESPLTEAGIQAGVEATVRSLAKNKNHTVCPNCKTTAEDYQQSGFLGCPLCYSVFAVPSPKKSRK